MIYIGLDGHKKGSVYCCQDESGKVIRTGQLSHTLSAVRQLVACDGQAPRVAIEATGSWQHVAAMLQSQGAQVVLSHPRRTRAIAAAKVKTDAIDARTLADLLRVGLLPQAYLAPASIQELRRRSLRHLLSVALRSLRRIPWVSALRNTLHNPASLSNILKSSTDSPPARFSRSNEVTIWLSVHPWPTSRSLT